MVCMTLRWSERDSNPRSPVEDSTFSRPPGNRRLRNRRGSQNRVLTITRAGFTVRRGGLASNAGRLSTSLIRYSEVARCLSAFRTYSSRANS